MRAWRNQRKLSLGKLSNTIRFNPSYMARVERGEQASSADLVTAYDHALGASGSLVRIYRSITEGANKSATAGSHVSNPGAHVSKGLVALEDESDMQASSSEGISVPVRTDDGRIIFVSVTRRALLGALGSSAALAALSDTPATARTSAPVAVPGVNPIEHLQATWKVLIDNDNLFGPHRVIPVVERQIAAIKALRQERRGSDRAQLLRLQTQYSELCGWLYQDIGNFRASQHWTREALEISHLAGDAELTTYILTRRSQIAGDMRDPIEALDVAEAAGERAIPRSRLAAVIATFGAHGHALRGDTAATLRAYDHAHDLRESIDPNPSSPWGVWLDAAYIDVHRAHSLSQLGDYKAAIEGFQKAIAQLPTEYHRDRGVYLAREAVAHAGAGDAERAAEAGLQALTIGLDTGSARITHELARLDNELNQWRTVPSVSDFKEAMTDAALRQV